MDFEKGREVNGHQEPTIYSRCKLITQGKYEINRIFNEKGYLIPGVRQWRYSYFSISCRPSFNNKMSRFVTIPAGGSTVQYLQMIEDITHFLQSVSICLILSTAFQRLLSLVEGCN
jgi:hypothetical protein